MPISQSCQYSSYLNYCTKGSDFRCFLFRLGKNLKFSKKVIFTLFLIKIVRTVDKQLVSLLNCPKERFVNVPLLWNHGSEMVVKI